MLNSQHDAQSRREPQRLDLSIVPGKSLGWFRLGAKQVQTATFFL